MNKKRFLLAPVFSFFDFKVYKEAASLKPGKSLLYLAYLSALFSAVFFLFAVMNLPKVDAFVNWIKINMAGMTITNSGMKLDSSGKKELIHPQFGPIAAFDDTREIVQLDEAGGYYLYVTSKMIYVNRGGTVQSNVIGGQAKKPFESRIDAAAIHRLYHALKWPIVFLTLLVSFVFGFMSRIFVALFLLFLGVLLQLVIPRKLSFGNLFNIAAFALSPALIFSMLQLIPALAPLSLGFLGLLLTSAYFVIGIMVQPKPVLEEDRSV